MVGWLRAIPVGRWQAAPSLPGPGHRVVWGGGKPRGLVSLKIPAGVDSAALRPGASGHPPMMEGLLAVPQERVSSRSAIHARSSLWLLSASMDPPALGGLVPSEWACALIVGLRSRSGLVGFVE